MNQKRIQLINPQSKYHHEGRAKAGGYSVFNQDNSVIQPLGGIVQAKVLTAMPKAIQYNLGTGPDVVTYHTRSRLFKQIQERSSQRDSCCAYGVEFMLELTNGEEVEFFFGSRSLRREAETLYKCVGHDVILTAVRVQFQEKYTWFMPDIWVRFKETQGFIPPEPPFYDPYNPEDDEDDDDDDDE